MLVDVGGGWLNFVSWVAIDGCGTGGAIIGAGVCVEGRDVDAVVIAGVGADDADEGPASPALAAAAASSAFACASALVGRPRFLLGGGSVGEG